MSIPEAAYGGVKIQIGSEQAQCNLTLIASWWNGGLNFLKIS